MKRLDGRSPDGGDTAAPRDGGDLRRRVDVVFNQREQRELLGRIIEIAREKVGKVLVANIVALGLITELADVVSPEAVEAAILARVPKGTEELNLSAFKAGVEAAQALGA